MPFLEGQRAWIPRRGLMILDNFVARVSSFMSLLPIMNDIQPDLPNNMTCSKVSCAAVAMDAKALAAWLIGLIFSLAISIFIHFLYPFDRIVPKWSSQARCFLIHRQIDKLPPSLMITLNDAHKVSSVYSVVDFKGKRCPRQQNVKTLKKPSLLPSLKLRVRPWKRMVGRWSFPFGARPIFRGHVSFRECKIWCEKLSAK